MHIPGRNAMSRTMTETWFFYGDSLTLAVNDDSMQGGWVGRLALMGSRAGFYALPPATFYNLGVRRHTVFDVKARWKQEWDARQLPGIVPHVAFCAGVVDMVPADGKPVSEVCAAMADMLDEAAALAPVLLISVPPVANAEVRTRIEALNAAYGAMCAQKGLAWADIYTELCTSDVYMDSLRDGTHAAPEGCAFMAERLFALPQVRAFLGAKD